MTSILERPLAGARPGADAGLNIALAYDNFQAGVYGKLALDRIAHDLGELAAWDISLWPFRLLEVEAFRAHTIERSAGADVLMISASGKSPLPGGVQDWLHRIIMQKCSRPCVLTALLHGFGAESQIASPVYASLQACAREHGLDFLSTGTAAAPQKEEDGSDMNFEKISRRAHTLTPLLQKLLHQTHHRP